jgi:membrane-anchored protein YejM (alkaline phosphatase superfamily)
MFVILADHGKLVGEMDAELPQSYNHIPCIIFGPGVSPEQYDGLAMQVDVMPTLLGLMGMSYDYDGFGIDLLRQRRQRVFYTSDTHIVARDSSAAVVYNAQMQKPFCYNVTQDGMLRLASAATAAHDSLQRYAFAMEQTAEYLQRHQQEPARH